MKNIIHVYSQNIFFDTFSKKVKSSPSQFFASLNFLLGMAISNWLTDYSVGTMVSGYKISTGKQLVV